MVEALSNNKRIAKNTLFMYFRMFFTMCVSLYTSRVVLATLGFTDYGLNNVIGGIIAMFGARLADGCPSGHGLSGGLQLAVSGYIALACFFIGGLISANLLYKGGGDK